VGRRTESRGERYGKGEKDREGERMRMGGEMDMVEGRRTWLRREAPKEGKKD